MIESFSKDNPVLLNGAELKRKTELRDQDVISIAYRVFIFRDAASVPTSDPPDLVRGAVPIVTTTSQPKKEEGEKKPSAFDKTTARRLLSMERQLKKTTDDLRAARQELVQKDGELKLLREKKVPRLLSELPEVVSQQDYQQGAASLPASTPLSREQHKVLRNFFVTSQSARLPSLPTEMKGTSCPLPSFVELPTSTKISRRRLLVDEEDRKRASEALLEARFLPHSDFRTSGGLCAEVQYTDCIAFLEGTCTAPDCPYRHSEAAKTLWTTGKRGKVCPLWREDFCPNPMCELLHLPSEALAQSLKRLLRLKGEEKEKEKKENE